VLNWSACRMNKAEGAVEVAECAASRDASTLRLFAFTWVNSPRRSGLERRRA
jgi:hypothetical protein